MSLKSVFTLTKTESEFRINFKKWLVKNLPKTSERKFWVSENLDERYAAWQRWQKKLYDGGWLGVSWPKQYGGRELSNVCEFIIGEELSNFRAPYSGNWISLAAIANALLGFGTDQQKRKYLPEIAKGNISWCLGVTEPDAGSNVMATATVAVKKNAGFVINGKKIWSTHSPRADFCLALVKTGKSNKNEWNLSMLIVDLKSKGVIVNPLRQLHGEANYGEIIFDDCYVPEENLVGGLNHGWIVQATTWLQESIPPFDVPLRLGLKSVLSDFEKVLASRTFSQRLDIAKVAIDAELVRLTTFRALRQSMGKKSEQSLPPSAPLIKIIFTEITQAITQQGLDNSSLQEQIKWTPQTDNWLYRHISARSNTIARAPSEIHRNFIARHFLGHEK